MSSSAQLGPHEVHFEDVGGEGPPILLTPGAAASARDLGDRFAPFATIYRLIAWDPPGTGDDAVREHARLAFDLLHHRGIERAILAGDGVGALVCLRAGLLAPDRVRGLVLFDLPPGDADEFARIEELDIPTVVLQAQEPTVRDRQAVTELAGRLRDHRGLHLLDGPAPAVDATRADTVDPHLRDFLESLPA